MEMTSESCTRRDFIKHSSVSLSTLGALTLAGCASTQKESVQQKKDPILPKLKSRLRLATVGTGDRGIGMWGKNMIRTFADVVQLVGLCDINAKRLAYAADVIGEAAGYSIPIFTDFDLMVQAARPDMIIITTSDAYHAQYVVRAMQLGCDVICEMPYGITAKQCQLLYDAQQKYQKNVYVTFNMRYFTFARKVQELIRAGEIGQVCQVTYQDFLNLDHGASYYRRWNAYKKYSGTMLVNRGAHHFDLVNWWVGAEPKEVFAYGEMKRFGPKGPFHYTHCRGCPYQSKCEFYWDIRQNKGYMSLYVQSESEDGYLRDACVFREDIDSYDTCSAIVNYENGAQLIYSLTAYAPYEGQYVTIQGDKGRIIARLDQNPWKEDRIEADIALTKNHQATQYIIPERQDGRFDNSDLNMMRAIFLPDLPDPLIQKGTSRDGLLSALVGIAGYTSIENNQPVRIKNLVELGE